MRIPPNYDVLVRDLRGRLSLTQAELAERLEVSYATVNRWENRQTRPNRLAWARFSELAADTEAAGRENLREAPTIPGSLDFQGSPEAAKLIVEGERLSLGHTANPAFATETSRIDPLPHQRIAVYDRMLAQNPLRFLLADDAGAGKTIMTGLYIREMLSRRLLRRVLIVPPAGLVGNWRRELEQLFGLQFDIVRGADCRVSNPFANAGSDRLIVSVDTLAAATARRRLQETTVEPFDLVVFDEAHKLSARLETDGTFRPTNRYRLAEMVAGAHPVPEEWQLHWHAHNLLLLTATPHMGKDFPYFCLWRLLEPDGFSTPEALAEASDDTKDAHFIRRTKEEMVTLGGAPLYPRRVSDTLTYELSQGPGSEQELYDGTTVYIRNYYNTARILNRSAARFAMTVFQRRLASSPWALIRSFERRLAKLEGLIDDIRDGRMDEEDLSRAQLRLDREAIDVFDTCTADEEEPEGGLEQNEAAEQQSLSGVVATSLAELEVERREVTELLDLAREVESRGEDSKFEALREVLGSPDARGEKLIVFSEHRDTLDFLVRRLEGMGFAGRIAQIHGGMDFVERERQVLHFKKKHEGGGAQFLVATDAAGEGINLQFCWRMVNYDIPWNPARLEQRMGRIHRYLQRHDPVVILNLVAGGTREGRVLKTLLDKLDVIREELGSDKVFDVIGRVFEGLSIRDYMEQALMDGERAVVALGSQLTLERVEVVVERERAIFGESGDVRPELPRLRGEIEREMYRRLLPGYVFTFLEQAGRQLGFRINGDPDGELTFEVTRPGSLDFLWPAIEQRTAGAVPRFTLVPRPDADVTLVHPGEIIFESLRRRIQEELASDALRGAVMVDASASEPYLLHVGILDVTRRASRDEPLLSAREPLETHLVAVRQTVDGETETCQPEVLLLTQGGNGVPPAALPLVARATALLEAAAVWVGDHVGVGFVEARRNQLLSAAADRCEFLRRGFDHRAAELASRRSELRAAAQAGTAKAQRLMETVREEQHRLSRRRDAALAAVEREPSLLGAEPVRFIAHFLVVPSDDSAARERFDEEVEAAAVRLAVAHEEALGARVEDVSTPARARAAGLNDWPGFDLLSTRLSGDKLAIEVKGRATTGGVEVSENEWAQACNLRARYWLYVAYGCGTAHPALFRVQDPFGRLLASPQGGVRIEHREIAAAAENGEA